LCNNNSQLIIVRNYQDRDFARIQRLGANEEIGNLLKGAEATPVTKKAGDKKPIDVKSWFKCYEANRDQMFDHIVQIDDENEHAEADLLQDTAAVSLMAHSLSAIGV